ncbi:transcriptional regulator [Massilia sp. Root133]|uniref:ATP-binding protein n=1 Tax=unclassified Massilia TaxID=2609279 RepID=UPI00070067D2|nr:MULTISPECIES: ATP-binding protein [unclassified Massilia]KQY00267.1 transcriptional regulator [Massilia sp. Root133]KQZ39023.1 transcriptional regulator [Massilia sp. Root1485]
MTAIELLESLNLLDEQERIEAKRASEAGKSILETVCAFANEPGMGGGWLALGVVREELALFPAYEVEGITNPEKISSDIANQCRDVFNIPLRVDISTENVQGKNVIVVFVPEAQPQDKPIFFKAQGLPRAAFRRIGSTDQRCTEDDMAVFYQGRQRESFDAGLVSGTTLEDLSPEALADYRQSRADANPDAEELRWSDEELLRALGCITPDTQTNPPIWRLTVAGIMMFGKPQALRRCFPMTRVDYIRVPGREWVPDPERRFDTIELRDSMFRLIRRAQAAVLDDLPKAFDLKEGGLQRHDKPVIPQRVIREALVNALMHRSYRSHSPVQIIRYANRLEIRNPGFSLKSPEHLGEPGSEPRNPRIAGVLHETRFAETKGSGIRVMRETMEQAGLTPPLFESDRGHDQFVARYFFHHFLGADDVAWLAQFKDAQLSSDEAKALIVVREAGAIDNANFRALTKVDTLTASTALRRLRDAGLLVQKGRGSATYYVAAERLGLGILSGSPQPLSSNLPALSSNLESLSSNPANAENEAARTSLLDGLPGSLAARLGSIGRRHPPQETQDLVVALCRLRAWRVDELALVLQRNPEVVRQNYLRPLMRDGRLAMTRPDEPNDPQQAYRAIEGNDRSTIN